VLVQTDLPHGEVRSNSLEVVGDMMVVCYQVRGGKGNPNDPNNLMQSAGRTPAGFDLFDISTPEKPKLLRNTMYRIVWQRYFRRPEESGRGACQAFRHAWRGDA